MIQNEPCGSFWAIYDLAPSNIGLVHRPLKAERRVRLPLELIRNSVKAPNEVLFLFIPEKDLESNRVVSAPSGEKAPRMAPSANEDGPAGVHRRCTTRGLRLPLELISNSVKAPNEVLFLFIPEKDTESNRGVSAPSGEKAPRMAPSANEDGPAGVHRRCTTRGLRLPLELISNSVKAPHEVLFLFIPEKDLESNRGVSATTGEKASRMAPSANEDGPVLSDRDARALQNMTFFPGALRGSPRRRGCGCNEVQPRGKAFPLTLQKPHFYRKINLYEYFNRHRFKRVK